VANKPFNKAKKPLAVGPAWFNLCTAARDVGGESNEYQQFLSNFVPRRNQKRSAAGRRGLYGAPTSCMFNLSEARDGTETEPGAVF